MEKIEYRVRPVTRYIVTRYFSQDESGRGAAGVSTLGEFDNEAAAYQVGYALAKAEHERLGWPIEDERIQYPLPPDSGLPATFVA